MEQINVNLMLSPINGFITYLNMITKIKISVFIREMHQVGF